MTNPDPRAFDKTLNLATLNTQSGYRENEIGPLIGMTNDGQQTILTYDSDGAPPTVNAVIAADGGVSPTDPTKVCSGTIFVSGTLTACTATRAAVS